MPLSFNMHTISGLRYGAMDFLRTFWTRITSSRLVTLFFLLSLSTSLVQTGLQVRAFLVNRDAAALLDSIILTAGLPDNDVTQFNGTTLQICDGQPQVPGTCEVVWASTGMVLGMGRGGMNGTETAANMSSSSCVSTVTATVTVHVAPSAANVAASPMLTDYSAALNYTMAELSSALLPIPSPTATTPPTAASVSGAQGPGDYDRDFAKNYRAHWRRSQRRASISMPNSSSLVVSGAPLVALSHPVSNATISVDCARVLIWPFQQLAQTKRRDAFFITFQLWVLGMSVYALYAESIPHLVAVFITQLYATGWTGFEVFQTASFKTSFIAITQNGACPGVDLLPNYWTARASVEIPTLVIHCVTLVLSVYLTWRLVKRFGWQTFKRIGASIQMHRYYRIVLLLSVSIQLATFFLLAFMALWLDQLWNGAIAHFNHARIAFRAAFIILIILTPFWLVAGWTAVYGERRRLMASFLAFAAIVTFLWGFLFLSPTFRLTFETWTFFATLGVFAILLEGLTLVLGIMSRLNFGKGLLEYFGSGDTDDESDEFVKALPEDTEKIHFPSRSSLPTFSSRAPSPTSFSPTPSSHFEIAERHAEPRNMPFVTITRTVSNDSTTSERAAFPTPKYPARALSPLHRSNTRSSTSSGSSGGSNASRDRRRIILE
ncbi:hypothetical protein CALCODRAFT_66638 [Calocera cornea HHB12733]|uniref:Uncharacterized protein n=1 Tax=Calocera cornea HHB12733 TaxID=1353952 RepID=A0A165DJU3_9BASI|nr:hypothetical protein CALCODRAFT_66638 [Calocera cornea HHB12733]